MVVAAQVRVVPVVVVAVAVTAGAFGAARLVVTFTVGELVTASPTASMWNAYAVAGMSPLTVYVRVAAGTLASFVAPW